MTIILSLKSGFVLNCLKSVQVGLIFSLMLKKKMQLCIPQCDVQCTFTLSGMVNYMLNYHGTPLPDAAYMVFDYGDGTVTSPIAFNPTYSHSYTYSTHGHYITTITLFNDASTSTTEIAVCSFAVYRHGC